MDITIVGVELAKEVMCCQGAPQWNSQEKAMD